MTETLSSREVRRITDLYVEVFSNQELHRAGEVMTADYVNHLRFGTVSGLDAFCEFMSGVYSGMPDIAWTILDTRVDGDRIIYHYEVAGTHQGDIMGSPPTGREIRISGIEMNRIEDGKIAETWNYADALSLLQQVGAIPGPPPDDGSP